MAAASDAMMAARALSTTIMRGAPVAAVDDDSRPCADLQPGQA
jgi:hypothetical protein